METPASAPRTSRPGPRPSTTSCSPGSAPTSSGGSSESEPDLDLQTCSGQRRLGHLGRLLGYGLLLRILAGEAADRGVDVGALGVHALLRGSALGRPLLRHRDPGGGEAALVL